MLLPRPDSSSTSDRNEQTLVIPVLNETVRKGETHLRDCPGAQQPSTFYDSQIVQLGDRIDAERTVDHGDRRRCYYVGDCRTHAGEKETQENGADHLGDNITAQVHGHENDALG